MEIERDQGSFRDPSGYIFYKNGEIFRSVSQSYRPDFELLKNSGLLKELIENNLLIPHQEVDFENQIYKTLTTVEAFELDYNGILIFSKLN